MLVVGNGTPRPDLSVRTDVWGEPMASVRVMNASAAFPTSDWPSNTVADSLADGAAQKLTRHHLCEAPASPPAGTSTNSTRLENSS